MNVSEVLAYNDKNHNAQVILQCNLCRIEKEWRLVDNLSDKHEKSKYIVLEDRLLPSSAESYEGRFNRFLNYIEENNIDSRSVVLKHYNKFKETGSNASLQYFIDKNLDVIYDTIVYGNYPYSSLPSSLDIMINDQKSWHIHHISPSQSETYFKVRIVGKFKGKSENSESSLIVADSITFILDSGLRFLPSQPLHLDLFEYNKMGINSYWEVIASPESYLGKEICLKGIWKQTISRGLYYLEPSFLFDLHTTADDKSETPIIETSTSILTIVPNVTRPTKKYAIEIADFDAQAKLSLPYVEKLGGDIARNEPILISGVLVLSEKDEFSLALKSVEEIAFRNELGTYYYHLV